MLDEIISGKVEKKVIITYKDRLNRIGFDLFLYTYLKNMVVKL